jgi:hypothetical protein
MRMLRRVMCSLWVGSLVLLVGVHGVSLQGEHIKAVEACTEGTTSTTTNVRFDKAGDRVSLTALADDPHYVKVLQRRATSNEAIASWSALTSAQAGMTKILNNIAQSHKVYRLPHVARPLARVIHTTF